MPDEAAFRETLALFAALLRIGYDRSALAVGFLPQDASSTSPMVVVTSNGRAATYRLNNHKLLGDQPACERRWRDWMVALLGDKDDIDAVVLESMRRTSRFGTLDGEQRLRAWLTREELL